MEDESCEVEAAESEFTQSPEIAPHGAAFTFGELAPEMAPDTSTWFGIDRHETALRSKKTRRKPDGQG
jgi:hypothetical protein